MVGDEGGPKAIIDILSFWLLTVAQSFVLFISSLLSQPYLQDYTGERGCLWHGSRMEK